MLRGQHRCRHPGQGRLPWRMTPHCWRAALPGPAGRGSVAQGGHGRYVVVRGRDGRRTAVARHAVSGRRCVRPRTAARCCSCPGGRIVCVEESLDTFRRPCQRPRRGFPGSDTFPYGRDRGGGTSSSDQSGAGPP